MAASSSKPVAAPLRPTRLCATWAVVADPVEKDCAAVSSSDNVSKRERQKQRRDVKLAKQRAAEARARRARLLTFVIIGLLAAAAVGALLWQQAEKRQEEAEIVARAKVALEEAGCEEIENLDDPGAGHLEQAALQEQPPEALYPDRPAYGGQHYGSWIKTGVYDELIDERALVHNLEHGYILAYYDEGADEAEVAELKAKAQEFIDDDRPKIIVSPWDGDLPEEGKNFAFVAWTHRQQCEVFNPDIFTVFVDDFHSGNGDAPANEKGIPAHLTAGGGTIDPGEEPFLLPPLGSAAPSDEGMGSSEGASEASS